MLIFLVLIAIVLNENPFTQILRGIWDIEDTDTNDDHENATGIRMIMM